MTGRSKTAGLKTLMPGRWTARDYQKPLLAYLEAGGRRADVFSSGRGRGDAGRRGQRERRLQRQFERCAGCDPSQAGILMQDWGFTRRPTLAIAPASPFAAIAQW